MNAATALDDFARVLTHPPSLDWAAISLTDDLKRLEKQVDNFESQATEWRASTIAKLQKLMKDLSIHASEVPSEDVQPLIAELLKVIESSIQSFSHPLHDDPEIASKTLQISGMSQSAGKFIRKLLRRIERIRVAQHAASVDMYYGLLALKSEYENLEEISTFDDPQSLVQFLRQKIA